MGPSQLLLQALALRNILGEAPGMGEPSVLPFDVGVNEHMLYRAILAPQPGLIGAEGFAELQAPEDVIDSLLVGVEIGNVPPHIFFTGITQEVQFRRVCS